MEAEFWHDCWEKGRLGFHQLDFNQHMLRFMPRLDLQPGAHVLVPLCGKSLDMLWLLNQGYSVTGIELSEKAVADFFSENGLHYVKRDIPGGTAWCHDRLEIHCTDLFESGLETMDPVDAVYDRAALPALPPQMRQDYAALMLEQLPLNTVILMQAMEYPQNEMDGPPFSVIPDEIEALYGLCCTIEALHHDPCLEQKPHWKERGLTMLTEHVYEIHKTRNPES
jgi:thiopurine S-methyltransferase